jgi:hypothetical protein
MTTPVSFEIAKLLKEKGFDELCNNHYSQALFEGTNPDWEGVFPKYSVFKHSDYHNNSKPNNNNLWFECSAPTISEVIMWLYEKHGVWVVVNIDIQNRWYFELFNLKDKRNAEILIDDEYWLNSPTEAYEVAIEYCLTNLI